jgi:hypothetical protein
MPAKDVASKINSIVIGPYQEWGGVMYPYFWLLRLGLSAMNNFDYIYCANGDCVLEKPENFNKLLDNLGDYDIYPVGWEHNGGRPLLNTTGFIAKRKAILDIMDHFEKNFIPLKSYERTTMDMGNTESRFAIAVRDLDIKVAIPENNPFNTQLHKKGGTWYDLVGFRHIHGEYAYAYKYKDIPPEINYYDQRFMSSEYNAIKEYWEKQDVNILKEKWWPK